MDLAALLVRLAWLAVAGGALLALTILVEAHRTSEGHKAPTAFMLTYMMAIAVCGAATFAAFAKAIG